MGGKVFKIATFKKVTKITSKPKYLQSSLLLLRKKINYNEGKEGEQIQVS